MKIKRFEAATEQEAIELVKEELGLSALILKIKKIQPKGFFALFRKPMVEITAAYDDKDITQSVLPGKYASKAAPAAVSLPSSFEQAEAAALRIPEPIPAVILDKKSVEAAKQQEKIEYLEDKLNSTEDLLQKVLMQLNITKLSAGDRKYSNNMLQIFYKALTEQGVSPEIAEAILEDVTSIEETDKIDINLIVKIVYNKIMSILGEPEPIRVNRKNGGDSHIIIFIGPTGVGKTTTIAKLSSGFILNGNMKVGLITADTYRIAAVEQLKTYADILGIDVAVAYGNEDILPCIDGLKKINDVILIDTAGRSHKNSENVSELSELLQLLPDSERYLVMSLTTKYDDLISIVRSYSVISDFKMIFTKLDETNYLGTILNICYITGKKISYITNGQNVPDDIDLIKPEKLARALLGLGGGI